jgi:TPR repeat protein
MKLKTFEFTTLWFWLVFSFQLLAQQNDADRKLFAEIRAKAEQGDAKSQNELGNTFYFGINGQVKNFTEAVKWFRKAADQECAFAQFNLGLCYEKGQGTAKNEAEAFQWFRKAAEQNNATAQCKLGHLYETGQGVTKDDAEAFNWNRKAAAQNYAGAQFNLGVFYTKGQGVAKDDAEAVRWFRKAAEQNSSHAQYNLGRCCLDGTGTVQNYAEAVRWFRKAAEQNDRDAEYSLGQCYADGQGVAKDWAEAAQWFRKAAERGDADAQYNLGVCYNNGEGVPKDYVECYKWMLLALAQGNESAKNNVTRLEKVMTREQTEEGQKLARKFKPRVLPSTGSESSGARIEETRPESSGTGFFITDDGYLITNQHVVESGGPVWLVTRAGLIPATVVKVDAANDLALLKTEGKSTPLPVAMSRTLRMGSMVATVGFPNIGLQGFAPKLAKGEIASLTGAQDDPKYFQISVPVQPGNSGGALVDERGNVVGVVSAKLDAAAALATSGSLPENVNYAVKSSFLLSFLESVPEVSTKLKEPGTKEMKFEDVVKQAEQAAVLVLVY